MAFKIDLLHFSSGLDANEADVCIGDLDEDAVADGAVPIVPVYFRDLLHQRRVELK